MECWKSMIPFFIIPCFLPATVDFGRAPVSPQSFFGAKRKKAGEPKAGSLAVPPDVHTTAGIVSV
jgi:hypothetical protein